MDACRRPRVEYPQLLQCPIIARFFYFPLPLRDKAGKVILYNNDGQILWLAKSALFESTVGFIAKTALGQRATAAAPH